jgi:hypothetical protein
MTVTEIMEKTGLKRGTIDQFRIKMQEYELISNNQSLNQRAVDVLCKADSYRNENNVTWDEAMYKMILLEYDSELRVEHYWTNKTIVNNLIWLIENKIVKVKMVDSKDQRDFHDIYRVMIDNFADLGKVIKHYEPSKGTDGNPTLNFKVYGKDYIYYFIGKYNKHTDHEDMHIFYNEGLEFNIMRCKYLLSAHCNGDLLKELTDILYECNRENLRLLESN